MPPGVKAPKFFQEARYPVFSHAVRAARGQRPRPEAGGGGAGGEKGAPAKRKIHPVAGCYHNGRRSADGGMIKGMPKTNGKAFNRIDTRMEYAEKSLFDYKKITLAISKSFGYNI